MGQLTVLEFLGHQFKRLPDVSSFAADLQGKTVIVTGANVGLGYEAAKHFARMSPAKLILACRDEFKGQAAAETIARETGCSGMECWKVDIGSFQSVKEFGERFEREGGGRLDILVENAGVSGNPEWKETDDGWESVFKVNHLGTWHLALRLLPDLLNASGSADAPGPRLVVVTSELHFWTYDEFALESVDMMKALNDRARFEARGQIAGMQMYGTTKLFNILLVHSLSRLLAPKSARNPHGLTFNAVNPGLCHSSLMRDEPWFGTILKALLARSTEVGARNLVWAATAAELEGKTGEYVDSCMVSEASDLAAGDKGEELAKRVWEATVKILLAADPGLVNILRHCGLEVDL